MESNDNFYVFLPSNSSADIYKDNTLSQYKVKLPKAIDLSGQYEVGLVESNFKSTWFNVINNETIININHPSTRESVTLAIREDHYHKPNELIQEINDNIEQAYTGKSFKAIIRTDPITNERRIAAMQEAINRQKYELNEKKYV